MNRTNLIPAATKFCCCICILLLSILTGCSSSLKFQVKSDIPTPLVSKIPLVIGVYYTDKFKNYSYHENSAERKNWDIESGPSQVAMFDQVLPSMFKQVKHINSLPLTGDEAGIQAVLIPSIEEMQFSLPAETHLDMYEVWIKYKLRLQDAKGNVIAEWSVTAYGKSSTKFLKNREKGLNDAMDLALRDAGAKIALGFSKEAGVNQWLASHVGKCTGQPEKTC